MEKGDTLYYARCLPTVGLNDLLELKIRTIENDWFVGTEKDGQAFCFNMTDLGNIIFFSREEALESINFTKDKVRELTTEDENIDE